MASEELTISIGARDSGALSTIKQLNNQLKFLDKEYALAQKSSKTFDSSLQGQKTKLEYLKNSYTVTAKKLDKYKNNMEKAKQTVEQKRQALEELQNAEGDNAAAIERAQSALDRAENSYHRAQQSIVLTEAELRNLQTEIDETNRRIQNNAIEQYQQRMRQIGESVQNAGEKISAFGKGLSSVGTGLLALSTPFITFSTYATKTTMEFEQSIADLSATSGATGIDLEKLSDKAKELGSTTSKSATESAEAMKYLALAGYDVNEILSASEPILKASVAWNSDLATSADLVTDSMSSLCMQTSDLQKFLDVCSQAQRSSNTSATQMMQAYVECGGSLKNLNVDLETSASMLGTLANQGMKGSEAGTSLNSILINLTGATSSAREAFNELGISAWDSEGNFIGLEQTLLQLKEALKGCTEEQKNNYLAQIGGKTQIDTLNKLLNGMGTEYNNLKSKISGCNGATEEMYDTMQNTSQGNITALKSKLESLGIQIGEKIVPHVNKLVDKLSDLIEWFGNLDEGTQSAILKFGLFTTAAGAAFKVVGTLTSGIGSLVTTGGKLISWLGTSSTVARSVASTVGAATTATSTGLSSVATAATTSSVGLGTLKTTAVLLGKGIGAVAIPAVAAAAAIYTVHERGQYLNRTMIESTEDLSLVEKAFNKINGSVIKSKQELIDLGIVYDEWSSSASQDYIQSLEDTSLKMSDLNFEVQRLANSNITISQETRNQLVKDTESMCNSIIEEIRSKGSETTQALQEAFSGNGKVDWYEETVINTLNRGNEESIRLIQEKEDEITRIYDNAMNEHREIAESEKIAIEQLYSEIGDIKARALAESGEEYQENIANFQVRARGKNAEGISGMLQDERKNYEERTQQTQEYYDTQIQKLSMNLNNMNTSERLAAEEAIRDLESERDTKLKGEEDYYKSLIDVVRNEYPEIAEIIDEETGKIRTTQEQSHAEQYEEYLSHMLNLENVTESGMQSIATELEDGSVKYQDYYLEVDKATGNIVGYWNKTTGEIQGKNAEICASLENQKAKSAELDSQYKKDINDMINSNKSMDSSTKNTSRDIVNSLQNIEDGANGTKTGIINLNGTPVKVTVNKDGTIANLNEIKAKMDAIPRRITTEVVTYHTSTGEAFSGSKYYSDGRGGYIDAYATGTRHAKKGWATVAEEGYELIRDGNKSILVGLKGMQLYKFKGGEVVYNAEETKKMMTMDDYIVGGGYFNPSSTESQQLVSTTTNNYNTNNTYSANNGTDINSILIKLDQVVKAISSMNIYLNADKVGNIIDKRNGMEASINERLGG